MKPILVAVVVVAGSSSSAAAGDRIVRPAVPADIEVDAQFRPFLVGHAVGTQNYICARAATTSGRDWVFIGPQATVYDARRQQIVTHFHSQNPITGAIEATWQHSRDSSAVWAVKSQGSSDPAYVAYGAIEWLRLDVSAVAVGPTFGDVLTGAQLIQRVNTMGGAKPGEAECTAARLNTRRLVPYEADYYFYR